MSERQRHKERGRVNWAEETAEREGGAGEQKGGRTLPAECLREGERTKGNGIRGWLGITEFKC